MSHLLVYLIMIDWNDDYPLFLTIDRHLSSIATQTMEVDLREDSDMWFAKGDVAIICGTTAFRVHEDVLCRHSRVFRDLCSGPKASGAEKVLPLDVTGCIVLHVVDTAFDMKQLLYALYDGLR